MSDPSLGGMPAGGSQRGLGGFDPRGTRGTNMGMNGPANIGGMRSSGFGIDTTDLDKLPGKLASVVTQIDKLTMAVDKLNMSLTKTGTAFGAVTGKSVGTATAGALTTSTFTGFGSGFGNKGPGPSESGPGGPNNTTAGFGGAAGAALGWGALGEMAAGGAGAINSVMSNVLGGGNLAIQQMAATGQGMFGRQTMAQGMGVSGGVLNQGPQSLAQAISAMQANPFLNKTFYGGTGGYGGGNQKNLVGFMNAVGRMQPGMAGVGAAQFANTLASSPALTSMMTFAGNRPGALLRPNTASNAGGINTPQQVFSNIIAALTGGQVTSPQQMKALSQNSGFWANLQTPGGMGTRMGLTPQELLVVQQFASTGGNIKQATSQNSATILSHQLLATTAGTALGLTATTGATGPENTLLDISMHTKDMADTLLKAFPGGAGVGDLVAKGMSSILKGMALGAGMQEGSKAIQAVGGIGGIWGLVKGVASKIGKFGRAAAPIAGEVALDTAEVAAGDPVTGSTTTQGMTPVMARRVGAMMAANPNLGITSGHRTMAQQTALYNMKGGRGVARPGSSMHQSGQAADLGPRSQFGWITRNARKFGLYTPAPRSEPWHVQAMGDPVTGSSVVSVAEGYKGIPYSYGGGTDTGPSLGINQGSGTVGYDCSAFVMSVFSKFGIQLPRTAAEQSHMGTAVRNLASAQPGDLLFYAGSDGSAASPGHVAIYIGGGRQIAAPETGTVIQIQRVPASSIVAIRRIVTGGAGKAVAQAATAQSGQTIRSTLGGGRGQAFVVGLQNTFLSQVGTVGGGWAESVSAYGPPGSSGGTSSPLGTLNMGRTSALSPVSGGTGGYAPNSSVVNAVKSVTSNRLLQIAMLTGATLESSQRPNARGQGSYGAWQIQLDAHPGVSAAEADNPMWAARYMLGSYRSALGEVPSSTWASNPSSAAAQVAALAERPAHGGGPQSMAYMMNEGGNVGPAYNLALSEVGDAMPGLGGARIMLNMPIQVVGVSQEDAQRLARMVLAEVRRLSDETEVSR